MIASRFAGSQHRRELINLVEEHLSAKRGGHRGSPHWCVHKHMATVA